jgi:hypothetical protein
VIDTGHSEADASAPPFESSARSREADGGDAEGATKIIEARVEGAASAEDARKAARRS